MRYLTNNALSQIDLEETIAWEQLGGLADDGDTEYAGGETPVLSPTVIRQPTVIKPVIRADPYAGMRPRGPSSGAGTGSHGSAYGTVTEAARTTRAPTPAHKQPEYKMPAQQAAAQKAPAKIDCADWRLRRCAVLTRLTAAQGIVAQLQAANASEGAISMAQENVAGITKEHTAIQQEAGAADCFSVAPAKRLCPGEKVETAYLMPSRGGYPAPYGLIAQALAVSVPASTRPEDDFGYLTPQQVNDPILVVEQLKLNRAANNATTRQQFAQFQARLKAQARARAIQENLNALARAQAVQENLNALARAQVVKDAAENQKRAAFQAKLDESAWLQKQHEEEAARVKQAHALLSEIQARLPQTQDAAEQAWLSKQRDTALAQGRNAQAVIQEIQARRVQIEKQDTLQYAVAQALRSAEDNVVRQMDVVTDWRVLTRK